MEVERPFSSDLFKPFYFPILNNALVKSRPCILGQICPKAFRIPCSKDLLVWNHLNLDHSVCNKPKSVSYP